MSVTEEEAKTKWCPYSRAGISFVRPPPEGMRGEVHLGIASANRSSDGLASECMCLGSACMSWRWDKRFGDGKSSGFCGLAGAPQ